MTPDELLMLHSNGSQRVKPKNPLLMDAAIVYVSRCRVAGDKRTIEALLREIVHPRLAAELAAGQLAMAWLQ